MLKSAKLNKLACQFFVTFILIILAISTGNCFTLLEEKDSIDNLSFSHDGKKVVFDRCQHDGCQIQVYDLETGELAAYQSPKNERWTMGKYSYDGKRITFSVIPKKPEGGLDLGGIQIAVMDADGKNYKKVTTEPGAKLYPTFSHSGKKILFARAKRIREQGGTPAAQYDAWEVDLTTGKETQLTFCEYYYLGYLTYFPDDERFVYYGEMPDGFEGMKSYKDKTAWGNKMTELAQKGMSIHGVVVMKGKELIPNPYKFPEKTRPEKPLLSKDGSVLIYEKSLSAGKFFLYSPDGNHRLVGGGGTINSAAISPDGEMIGIIAANVGIHLYSVRDGSHKERIYVPTPRSEGFDYNRLPKYKLLSKEPSKIINK